MLSKEKYVISGPQVNFISYLTDWVVIVCLLTLFISFLGFEPLFFTIPHSATSFQKNLVPSGELNVLYEELSLLFILAYLYFFVDSLTGLSIGKIISGIRSAIVKRDSESKSSVSILWVCWRAMVKTLPFLALGDLIKRKWGTLMGYRVKKAVAMKILTVSPKKEPSTFRIIMLCSIIYFLPLLAISLVVGYTGLIKAHITPSPSSSFSYSPSFSQARLIAFDNINFDVYYYFLGGATGFFLDILQLFSSSYTSSLYIGGSLSSHPSFIIFGVFPHFFIESFGFIFGIVGGYYILSSIIIFVTGFYKKNSYEVTMKKVGNSIKSSIYSLGTSALLIMIAAIFETFITPYFLSHYYYMIHIYLPSNVYFTGL